MAGEDDSALPPQNLLHPVYTVTNIQDKVRVLDGQKVRYATWKRLFHLHAKAYQVLHHIDATPKPTSPNELALWDEIDTHVLLWIYGTLTDDLLARVLVDEDEDESTAYEAWNRVKNIFDNTNLVSRKKTRWSRCIPHEIMMDIYSWLPVKTVARLKCVSKTSLNLILSPEFVQLHHGRGSRIQNSNNLTLIRLSDTCFYSFDFNQPQRPAVLFRMHPEVVDLLQLEQDPWYGNNCIRNGTDRPKILGLINGVLCFRNSSGELFLYNPVTRAYKHVQRDRYTWRTADYDEFAYDCVSDDFKIIIYLGDCVPDAYPKHRSAYKIYLYSLKENSWSKIRKLGTGTGFNNDESCHDIATHSMYWITSTVCSRDRPVQSRVITRFDVSSYEFEEIAFPSQVDLNKMYVRLEVLNKQLHALAHDQNNCSISILMMEAEAGCWTQLFHCSDPEYQIKRFRFPAAYRLGRCYATPYAYSKDGHKIFVGVGERLKHFICCDLESQSSSVFEVPGLPEGLSSFTTPVAWTPSLVPLA